LKILKKFWFVIVVFFLLIGLFIYVTIDDNKGKLKGMKYNGQDVIFSIGDRTITAEMLFDQIATTHPDAINEILLDRFIIDTLNQAMPITKEMREEAEEAVYGLIYNFQYYYGDYYEYYLQQWMASRGYSDITDIQKYTLPNNVIKPRLMKAYFQEHFDQYWSEYSQNRPRLVSHILVKMADSLDPTEEEMAKVKAVEEALKTKSFSEVALEFSDDGSAEAGGLLGIMDDINKSGYVYEFYSVAMVLENDEVSDWTVSSFGWHLIKNEGSSKEKLLVDDVLYDRFIYLYYDEVGDKVVYQKAVELGINYFGNSLLQKFIMDEMGVDE
jgi:foldase protein PrsA